MAKIFNNLTPEQLDEAYEAIQQYVLKTGLFPSLAHLAEALELTQTPTYSRLLCLAEAGQIETVKRGGGSYVTYKLPEAEMLRLLQIRHKSPRLADAWSYDPSPRLRVYNYVVSYVLQHGVFPQVGTICGQLDYSNNSAVYHHLDNLVKEGKLEQVGTQYKLPDSLMVDIYSHRLAQEASK